LIFNLATREWAPVAEYPAYIKNRAYASHLKDFFHALSSNQEFALV